MNDDDLVRVLDHHAGDVVPPTDLLDSVERRYRRRRAVRSGAGAALLAVVAIVAVTALRTTVAPHPAPVGPATVAPPRAFTVPRSLVGKDTMAARFSGAVFDIPHYAPGGLDYQLVAPMDATHLLAFVLDPGAKYAGLHRYDVTTETFGPEIGRVSATFGSGSAYGARYYVWSSYTDDGQNHLIRAVDLSTGQVKAIAVVDAMVTGNLSLPAGWYTDDSWIYSSNASGVQRLSLAGGAFEPVPGFEGMGMRNGTPWAARTAPSPAKVTKTELVTGLGVVDTELRDVVTGQTVAITVPADAKALTCIPAICVGYGRSGAFIQHPDGSDRVALPLVPQMEPELVQPWQVYPTAGGALLVSTVKGVSVIDPFTGAEATVGGVPLAGPDAVGPSLTLLGRGLGNYSMRSEFSFMRSDLASILVLPYLKG